jgi:drug/metabolite transporter (DMT)-like permease
VLGSLYPVVTAILAAVVLKERLRPVQYAGVCVTMLGVVLVSAGGA